MVRAAMRGGLIHLSVEFPAPCARQISHIPPLLLSGTLPPVALILSAEFLSASSASYAAFVNARCRSEGIASQCLAVRKHCPPHVIHSADASIPAWSAWYAAYV